MSNNRTLLEKLRDLGTNAEKVTDGYLNYGGCCVFAAIVGERLEKLGYIVEGKSYGDFDDVEQAFNEVKEGDYHSFFHVFLHVIVDGRRYVFDSDTCRLASSQFAAPNAFQSAAHGSLTVAQLKELAGKRSLWNSDFPRHTVPKLRQLADKILEAA